MVINRRVFSFFVLLFSLNCFAQTISVSSFKLLDMDLTANTAGTMETDQNGETAALIKVVTTQTGFTFDGGALGIVKTVQKPSEIWVYVPRGLKKLTISHPQLGILRDYYLNIPIEAARTYEMVLVAGEVQTIVKQARTSQYVVFQLVPPEAVVELNGELLKTEGGVASKMMKFGTYNYRVQAPDYLLEAGSVTIDDPDNKKIVNISLKPNFAQVNIKVDNNAEIWINGNKKGEGSWSGNLGAGTYEIEAKKAGHRSTLLTKDIEVTPEPQTISLQAPTPIYGEADINSSPGMADIYIDGEKVGQTPQLISNILVGEHRITLVKEGYEKEYSSIKIEEGEIKNMSFQLKEIQKKKEAISQESTNITSTEQYPLKSDAKTMKKILNSNNYYNAQKLVNESVHQLSVSDRAAAYNKLVDLAFDAFNKQSTIETENQLAKQMGKAEKYVDKKTMTEMAYNALIAARECDFYDQQPNEKGKVAPKFAERNAQRLWMGPRNQLVNAGQEAVQNKDNATARKYWQLFAESDQYPLFKNCNREPQKPYFGQVARFAAVFAYQDKDMDKAVQLCDIAMQDPEEYEGCLNLKLEILSSELHTKADSIKFINQLKDIYAKHKTDGVMEKLYNMYSGLGEVVAANKLLDDALSENPNNFVALADKGLSLLNNNPDEAAIYLKKATQLKSDNAALQTYTGTALSILAQNTTDNIKKNALYKEAIYYYDKAKQLDPYRQNSNWGYNRYNAYYNYYGPNAPETQQAEADSK